MLVLELFPLLSYQRRGLLFLLLKELRRKCTLKNLLQNIQNIHQEVFYNNTLLIYLFSSVCVFHLFLFLSTHFYTFLYLYLSLGDSLESSNKNSKSNHDEGGGENSPQNINESCGNEQSTICSDKERDFKIFNCLFSMEQFKFYTKTCNLRKMYTLILMKAMEIHVIFPRIMFPRKFPSQRPLWKGM